MELTIRPANLNDAKTLFAWANHEDTRQNSFQSNKISWDDHVVWLKKQLNNPKSIIYILALKEKEIGVVRFALAESTTIGVTVAPNCRGLGYGAPILKRACTAYWLHNSAPILAYIKKENLASKRIFEKAGFTYLKEGQVNHIECLILSATKNDY